MIARLSALSCIFYRKLKFTGCFHFRRNNEVQHPNALFFFSRNWTTVSNHGGRKPTNPPPYNMISYKNLLLNSLGFSKHFGQH